jgi:RimJ/RimL family protein N-acetyltransferase
MNSEASIEFLPMDHQSSMEIHAWPPYLGEFKPLDYALRPGGWLDTLPESSTTRRFIVKANRQLVGFSILTDITSEAAEIYLAVRPGLTGHGIGRMLMELTLAKGFRDMGLSRAYLKVRIWHKHAIDLYEKVGFVTTGHKREEVAGEMVDFQIMELQAKDFKPVA